MTETSQLQAGRWPLHAKIFIGLLVGVAFGLIANIGGSRLGADLSNNGLADWIEIAIYWAEGVGQVFLRLMFMVVLPLVFSALSLAVVEIGDPAHLGRVGLRTIGFVCVLSITAVLLGVGLVNLIQPGKAVSVEQRERLEARFAKSAGDKEEKAKKSKPIRDTIIDMLPENPLQEAVGALDGSSKGNGMLAVMFFAIVVGLSCAARPVECRPLVELLGAFSAVSMIVIEFAMKLAPYGAGCLVFAISAQLGLEMLTALFWFAAVAILGLAIQMFVVYSLVLRATTGESPLSFFNNISEAIFLAFGTSSSSATLPTSIRVAETNLHLPPKIANFVLTVGATGNQNGTALFEGVVILFLAQVLGINLSLADQLQVVLMASLAGIGTAGVPGGSIPMIVLVMQSVGIPAGSIAIILGVDRLLDMCRTVVNVTGDLVIAKCVSHLCPDDAPVTAGHSSASE